MRIFWDILYKIIFSFTKILFYTICPKISSKTRMPGKWGGAHRARPPRSANAICPKISSKTRMPGKWGVHAGRAPPRSANGWVCGWLGRSVGQWVGSGQMTNNCINFDLIEIIQFCLKIYDL